MNYALDLDVDLEGNTSADIFKGDFSKERNILNYIFGENTVNEIINDKPRALFIPRDNLKCILENLYKFKNIGGVTEYDVCFKDGDVIEVNDVDYLKGIYTNDGAIMSMTWIVPDLYDYLCEFEIYTSYDSIHLMLSNEMNDVLSGF